MAKLIFSLLILLSSSNFLISQTLRGTVYDFKTKAPIAEVNVFLDGTSIHTTTDKEGKFELNVGKLINTNLIISHIAYDMISIPNPFIKIPDKIYLKEKQNVLSVAVIKAEKFSRKQKLKVFREQFLGKDRAGKSCKILNETDIRLVYDYDNNLLSAFAEQPLIVENEFLAYKVQLNLVEFKAQFNKNVESTLDDKFLNESLFLVTSSFVDLNPTDKKIQKRRDEVYKKSAICFFKNFANNTLKEAKYRIFNKSYQVDYNMFFTMRDTLGQKEVQIIPDSGIDKFVLGMGKGRTVYGKISALYDKKLQSDLIFLVDNFLVDQYGVTNVPGSILFSGYFGAQGVGGMLPLNYLPSIPPH